VGASQRVDLGADELFAPAPVLADQARPLEHRNVLLHRREADRVEPSERRDRQFPFGRAAEDVAPGGVAEGLEEQIGAPFRVPIYNHMVVS